MDMGAFFRDYGTPFATTIAVLNSIISLVIGQYFKDSPRARIILVVASVALSGLAVGATFYSQYQIVSSAEAQNEKRLAMKDLLGAAIYDAETLPVPKTESQDDVSVYVHDYDAWNSKTARLIEVAYGRGEANRFTNYAGMQIFVDINAPSTLTRSKLGAGIQRLNELIPRVDSVSMLPEFDPRKYHSKQ
jgi:hypothetical protein